MWLENLKALKDKAKKSCREISIGTNMPEKTISRIFSGTTESPTISTLIPIVNFLGGSFDEVFADTQAVIGNTTVSDLQENVEAVESEKELLLAENKILQDKVSVLTQENELLKMKLMHKEELLAVHNYYTKIKCD